MRGDVVTRESGDALRGILTLRDPAARDLDAVTVEKAVDYVLLARATLHPILRD